MGTMVWGLIALVVIGLIVFALLTSNAVRGPHRSRSSGVTDDDRYDGGMTGESSLGESSVGHHAGHSGHDRGHHSSHDGGSHGDAGGHSGSDGGGNDGGGSDGGGSDGGGGDGGGGGD